MLVFGLYEAKLVERFDCANYYGFGSKESTSKFWLVPDCDECIEFLNHYESTDILGQSRKYLMLRVSDPNDPIGGKEVIYALDKIKMRTIRTELGDYHLTPGGLHLFKFISPNTAVVQAVGFDKEGFPHRSTFIKVEFPN